MHCTPLPAPLSEEKVLHTLDTLRSVVAFDDFIQLVVIRNGAELLQWSVAPVICDRRLNVILTMAPHSQSLRAATRLTIIEAPLSVEALTRTMTDILHRAINPKCGDKKRRESLALSYKDLVLMSELITSGMEDDKQKSNKRQRLKARLNIHSKYDLYLFIHLIYALPPALLKVTVEGHPRRINHEKSAEQIIVSKKYSGTLPYDKSSLKAEIELGSRRHIACLEL